MKCFAANPERGAKTQKKEKLAILRGKGNMDIIDKFKHVILISFTIDIHLSFRWF